MNFITSEKKDKVTTITLNRPDKFNSFNREMAWELHAALDEAEAQRLLRRRRGLARLTAA